jgi:hypothetical protein
MFRDSDQSTSWFFGPEAIGPSGRRTSPGQERQSDALRSLWQSRAGFDLGAAGSETLVFASLAILDVSIARIGFVLTMATNLINVLTTMVACALVLWWALEASGRSLGAGYPALAISAAASAAGLGAILTLL